MDVFKNAKVVRLKSHHGKYLHADEDEDSVTQSRTASSKKCRWSVEFVENIPQNNIIRLKSTYGKYLTASNQPFLLGMTGLKVLQTRPRRLDSSVEWEPVKEGNQVKLKTRYGQFLRANGGVPPWRNSITHDIPHRTSTQDWILWDVDVVDIVIHSPAATPSPQLILHSDSLCSTESSSPTHSAQSEAFSRQQSADSFSCTPSSQGDGRIVYYHIADEFDDATDDADEEHSIRFKGNSVDELTRTLEQETGIEGLILCSKNPLNGKLYQIKLQLPPNYNPMNIVAVTKSSSNSEVESLQ